MLRQMLSIAACLLGLAGCVATPTLPSPSSLPWHDDAFAYNPALVAVSKPELFRLAPDLEQKLKDPAVAPMSMPRRLQHLITLLYSQELKHFPYSTERSTIAAETWQQKRGDCLSLTVLAFSMARALDLDARMQEVRVPLLFDRRGEFDFVSAHVNVRIRKTVPFDQLLIASPHDDTLVDFEPSYNATHAGLELSDDEILARFYNNIAVEYLGKGLQALAYAHFKAAIVAAPGYGASYSNLALLYQRAGLITDAEVLLRQAIALNGESVLPLLALQQLLVDQGRLTEAQELAKVTQSRRELDPYYWLGLGVQRLQDGQYLPAIAALERAKSLTSGYEEVHRYLALAYWRAGNTSAANEQLALLGTMTRDQSKLVSLRNKLKRLGP